MNEKYVLRVPLDNKEKDLFLRAYKKSGFKTMSEFVRFLTRQYIAAVKK